MKKRTNCLSVVAAFGLAFLTSPGAPAQKVESKTTTTTTTGRISEFGGDVLALQSDTSPQPIRYSFTESTTYVDETGAPISRELLKAGLPVTVHYVSSPDGMLVSKVIVKKSAIPSAGTIKETTTTRTIGTISEFGPEMVVVKTEKTEPLRYRFTKTTKYVDESGAPVSRTVLKAGLPVTVYYTRSPDGMVASKVVVKKTVSPSGGTVEETTTTRTLGTVAESSPEVLVVKTKESESPIRYTFTKTTTYVDETGAPVAPTLITAGLPVTVHYARDGDSFIARRVIVRTTTTTEPPVIIREKDDDDDDDDDEDDTTTKN